jgi:hypothetical protein
VTLVGLYQPRHVWPERYLLAHRRYPGIEAGPRSEYRKWRRDEQVLAAIELKLTLARLRGIFSHSDEEPMADGLADGFFDFSDVNAEMAMADIVGSGQAVDAVKSLQVQLCEFVNASNSKNPNWRDKRVAVESTEDHIVNLVRKEV